MDTVPFERKFSIQMLFNFFLGEVLFKSWSVHQLWRNNGRWFRASQPRRCVIIMIIIASTAIWRSLTSHLSRGDYALSNPVYAAIGIYKKKHTEEAECIYPCFSFLHSVFSVFSPPKKINVSKIISPLIDQKVNFTPFQIIFMKTLFKLCIHIFHNFITITIYLRLSSSKSYSLI